MPSANHIPPRAAITGMAARWYPLQGLVRPNRQFDISFITGIHYLITGGNGIHGPDVNGNGDPNTKLDNTGRGVDGMGVEFGATLELYPANEWDPAEALVSRLPVATDPTALPQSYRISLGIAPIKPGAPPSR